MKHKIAAIELSANVIVIIIISVVILGAGLILFFNIKSSVEDYSENVEQQAKDQLIALMLNDNSKVAVYPTELVIQPGAAKTTTVAVMNIVDSQQSFFSVNIDYYPVFYYMDSSDPGEDITPGTDWWKNDKSIIVSKETASNNILSFGNINPKEQEFRNILVKMPKTAKKGQYVITVNMMNASPGSSTCNGCPIYGSANIYVTVP